MSTVIEDEAAPVLLQSFARVGMLVEMRAIEIREPMLVRREMRGNPVQNNTDTLLMQHVDEVNLILVSSVATRRGEEPRNLIPPGSVEWMLHDRAKFHVRENHLLQIGGQARGKFAVREGTISFFGYPPPRAQMQLVNRYGRFQPVFVGARRHPVLVVPDIVQIPYDRAGQRWSFGIEGEGIGLVRLVSVIAGDDMIFVARARWDPFNEGLPNAGVSAKAQSMSAFAPAIEVAHYRHLFGVGGPHREMCPVRAIQRDE